MHHTYLPEFIGKMGATSLQLVPLRSHHAGILPAGVETIMLLTFKGFEASPKLKVIFFATGLAGIAKTLVFMVAFFAVVKSAVKWFV
jgi:hypothetical protein